VLDPRKDTFLAVHTFSYWLLRYLVPVLLVAVAVVSVIAAFVTPIVWLFVAGQALFYVTAAVGYAVPAARRISPVSVAFSYCWANIGVAIGLLAFSTGTRLRSY
jgi:hypothetical protein